MKTLKLLRKYHCWTRKKTKQERYLAKGGQWRVLCKDREKEIIKSLFLEIPELLNFTARRQWGNYLASINNEAVPNRALKLTDETKSWLMEVNLKMKEVELIFKVLSELKVYNQDVKQGETFSRGEFIHE